MPDRGPRAILAVVAMYGPAEAAAIARSGSARVAFLDYDRAVNDSATR